MGCTLVIGESEIFYDQEDTGYVKIDAKTEKLDNAPAFGEPTDHENQRWPSYTSWANFVEFADLEVLFSDSEEGNLIPEHPGVSAITKHHIDKIDEAYSNYLKKYPTAKATYETGTEQDGHLCRLEWLKFWLHWAFQNCEKPVFVNS